MGSSSPSLDSLRSTVRRKRRALSPADQSNHARAVTRHLTKKLNFDNLTTVACYIADDGEIDLSLFMTRLAHEKLRVVVPCIGDHSMHFGVVTKGQQYRAGQFGILEPVDAERVELEQISLILAPLVAFSASGDRLGRGGGYYDRTLNCGSPPFYVGIAHELQFVESLERKPTDVTLDAVVTEKGWRIFSNKHEKLMVEN